MIEIPEDAGAHEVHLRGKTVTLTNLQKIFWPDEKLRKRDLLLYYDAISPVLLPHLKGRACVMKRYPNGIDGEFFFMKRTPANHPSWLETCPIEHRAGNVIAFPMVNDLPSLLWVVNLGCIDLNQWYGACSDFNRPDYLHFDLDPVPPADFSAVRKAALAIRDRLTDRGITCYPKTTGSRGIHIYVPLVCGPVQKQVWSVAKRLAVQWAGESPDLLTAEYRIEKRPPGRVLVDYNQNAWGRTLASAYSVRPKPGAAVSAPVTWEEVEAGIEIGDFTLRNMAERVAKVGDLFHPLTLKRGRHSLESLG